jgi:hypothetical protein
MKKEKILLKNIYVIRGRKVAVGKEIKLNEEAFNIAILKLTEYSNILVEARDSIALVNDNMKNKWLGEGGIAFMLSSNVLESRFSERINDLLEEINDLKLAKESMFEKDSFLSETILGLELGN